jgi:hypothetical protein
MAALGQLSDIFNPHTMRVFKLRRLFHVTGLHSALIGFLFTTRYCYCEKDGYNTDMSEYEESSEYKPMSPMMRYYNDINVVRESETSAMLAIDNLVQNFPIDNKMLFTKMMDSDLRPREWEMENDIVIAKEKLALLPLYVIGPELEDSSCDLDDLKLWYRDSLRGTRMIAQDIHTDECLNHTQPAHRMCDYSTTCPRRFSQQFLLFPAITPDFNKDIYKTAPKREFTIVMHKLDLAMSQGLIGFDACEDLRGEYKARYETYMSTRSLSEPDKIA